MAGELVEVVVAGLTAGAAAGVRDTASHAVRDAYAALVAGLRQRFGRAAADELRDLAATHAEDADQGREHLVRALAGVALDPDSDLVTSARDLLARLAGESTSRYTVDAGQAQGVQVGEHNSMTLNIDARRQD
jgi:hypothetical protein